MVFPFPQVLLHAAKKNAAEVLRSIGPSGLQFLHRIRDGLLHSIGGLLRLPAHAGLPRQHQRYRAACGHAEAERQQKGSYLHRSSSLHAFLHG